MTEAEQSGLIKPGEQSALLALGFSKVVEELLENGTLKLEDDKRFLEFREHFSLSDEILNLGGALEKYVKMATLQEAMEGKIPDRMRLDECLPINFQKGEQIVWAFPNSKYYEDKTSRQYIGGSHGASIRIMKGVYYRIGAFRGHAVDSVERIHVDTGWVVLTNKNIYFSGAHKSMRVPYSKIVSFEPYSDGIGIRRDAATAKPQILVTGDGWFTYNLAINLSQI